MRVTHSVLNLHLLAYPALLFFPAVTTAFLADAILAESSLLEVSVSIVAFMAAVKNVWHAHSLTCDHNDAAVRAHNSHIGLVAHHAHLGLAVAGHTYAHTHHLGLTMIGLLRGISSSIHTHHRLLHWHAWLHVGLLRVSTWHTWLHLRWISTWHAWLHLRRILTGRVHSWLLRRILTWGILTWVTWLHFKFLFNNY